MTINMIQKVARSLSLEEKHTEEDWPYYCKQAKAAIKALRKPNKKLREGVMQASLNKTPIMYCEEESLRVWQNTIDSILNGY